MQQQQQQPGLRSGQRRGERTTPLIVVTSVFAQPDSESEELLKCGVELFWVLQESAIIIVSFHISYTAQLCMCATVFKCSIKPFT